MEITIEYKGVEFEVEFDHYPEEEEVRYYPDGSGHPGSPEMVEIEDIKHKGTSFLEFFENEISSIEEAVMEGMRIA